MRGAGEILLVSCYELGHQPMGLAMPLGFLERAGYAPRAVDLAAETMEQALGAEVVRRARYVGISVPMHTALRMGTVVARRVRALNPRAHVCFYGLYAPLQREWLLGGTAGEAPLADSVLGGECEAQLVEGIRALEAGLFVEPAPEPPLVRLPFAVPSRAGLPPPSRYARIERADGTTSPAGHLEASRGCLHACRHCPIPVVYGRRFFVVPEEVVLEDARRQAAAGATHFSFGDPDFLNGPKHALRIARALHRELPHLTFDVTAKIEHVLRHREVWAELSRLGCLFVVSAVESLSPRVLEVLDKGHDRADVVRALGVLREAGIALRPSLVPFTPWETLESYRGIFDFLEEHELVDAIDPVHLGIRLLVPPGSLLLERPEMRAHLDLAAPDGGFDAERLTFRWKHPDPRMDALSAEAAALAARDAKAGVPPRRTYLALRELAFAGADGASHPDRARRLDRLLRMPTQRGPKLSETWFC